MAENLSPNLSPDFQDPPWELDAALWQGSFNGRESSLHQLSPYVGKLKSGMAKVLIKLYSQPGKIVLDPFAGSGVVPLECILSGRIAWANDLSPYAYILTRGKLETPREEEVALATANSLLDQIEPEICDIGQVPQWVRDFFHPQTLPEIISTFRLFTENNQYFFLACLLGILQHIRPGFLSYPASHLVPYLRVKKYPPDQFPEMYEYRDVRSRLLAKIKRAYRHPQLPENWENRQYYVWQQNAMNLPIPNQSVDAIISSPPYFGALDYARDNRLRLWFLGCENWKELDATLTAKSKVYLPQMSACLQEIARVLKPGHHCVLVLGDVQQNGKTTKTAEILAELAVEKTGAFVVETIYDDQIPDERRSRRGTHSTKLERILVMRKI
jgi:SAM-dependent methyltransferase